jgi:mRNA interferase RelE/StbE
MATTYRIVLTSAAKRDLRSLPRAILRRVDAKILALGRNPRPQDATKLRGQEGFMRVRLGDYRIIYQVVDDHPIVLVVRIGHRREVYR